MNTRVALTDDEVIALAARSGRQWPTVLPTVDLADDAAIQTAANRGARSLVARELLVAEGDGQLNEGLEKLVRPVLEGQPAFGTYVVAAEFRLVPSQTTTACYDTGGGSCISELTSGAGIHYLSTSTSEECLKIVQQLATATYDAGLPDAAGDTAVAYAVVGPVANEAIRMAAISRGTISAVRVHTRSGKFEVIGSMTEPSSALEFVLRADMRGVATYS